MTRTSAIPSAAHWDAAKSSLSPRASAHLLPLLLSWMRVLVLCERPKGINSMFAYFFSAEAAPPSGCGREIINGKYLLRDCWLPFWCPQRHKPVEECQLHEEALSHSPMCADQLVGAGQVGVGGQWCQGACCHSDTAVALLSFPNPTSAASLSKPCFPAHGQAIFTSVNQGLCVTAGPQPLRRTQEGSGFMLVEGASLAGSRENVL